MAQISIVPPQPAGAAAGAGISLSSNPTNTAPTKSELEFNRSVSTAVQTLNEIKYAGDGREVTISLDQATRRPVVKVVETATNEVIQQWPSQYVLQLAADSQKTGQ
jgi:uncharacterized FlaG/YvyC family protein